MAEAVQTPAEIEAERLAKRAKTMRVAKWAPLAVAGLLCIPAWGGFASALSAQPETMVLAEQAEEESLASAEAAEQELAAAFEGLVRSATGVSGERVETDRAVIEQLVADLMAGEEAKGVPEDVAGLLEAVGGAADPEGMAVTVVPAGVAATDYSYIATIAFGEVVEEEASEGSTEKVERFDPTGGSVVLEITVSEKGEAVRIAASAAGAAQAVQEDGADEETSKTEETQ